MDLLQKVQNLASSLVALTILIFVSLYKGLLSQDMDYKLTTPASVSVLRGLCVHIPCNFTYNATQRTSLQKLYGYWFQINYKYVHYFVMGHSYRIVPGLLVATDDRGAMLSSVVENRFEFTGNPHQGNCSFSVLDAKSQDQGQYYFRIEDDDLRYSYVTTSVRSHRLLQIFVTDKPQIQNASSVFSGKESVFICSVPGSCSTTEPEISWETVLTEYRTSQWSQQHLNGSWTYSSKLTFTPSPTDQGKWLTCRVWYPDREKIFENTVLLDVADPFQINKTAVDATKPWQPETRKSFLETSAPLFLIFLYLTKSLGFCTGGNLETGVTDDEEDVDWVDLPQFLYQWKAKTSHKCFKK